MSFFTNPAQQMTLDDALFSLTAREPSEELVTIATDSAYPTPGKQSSQWC